MTGARRVENRLTDQSMSLEDARAYFLASLEFGVNPLVREGGEQS